MDNEQKPTVSPDIANLFAEAMFWKQKYFELLTHSNQVIAVLSRPSAPPEQLAAALSPQPRAAAENGAQNGTQG